MRLPGGQAYSTGMPRDQNSKKSRVTNLSLHKRYYLFTKASYPKLQDFSAGLFSPNRRKSPVGNVKQKLRQLRCGEIETAPFGQKSFKMTWSKHQNQECNCQLRGWKLS
jgi:hypothetical protein